MAAPLASRLMPGGRWEPRAVDPETAFVWVSSDRSMLYHRIRMLFADLAPARAELLDMLK